MPESPRWLLDTGKPEEATKVLRAITRRNGRSWPDQVELDACNKVMNGIAIGITVDPGYFFVNCM